MEIVRVAFGMATPKFEATEPKKVIDDMTKSIQTLEQVFKLQRRGVLAHQRQTLGRASRKSGLNESTWRALSAADKRKMCSAKTQAFLVHKSTQLAHLKHKILKKKHQLSILIGMRDTMNDAVASVAVASAVKTLGDELQSM